jgi:tetratricopeptide (TPR) repeat protein
MRELFMRAGATFVLSLSCAVQVSAQDAAADATESMAQSQASERDMDDARARAAFRLGQQHYQGGRFAEAAVEFERAYGLSGRAQLLYNTYLAYRDAGDTGNALRALRSYLTAMPDAPEHEHLSARLAALQSQVSADEERQATVRAEAERARLDAEDARRELEEARRPRTRTVAGEVWPWAITGVGGAMLVAGAVTGGLALDQSSQIQSQCALDLCPAGFDIDGRRSTLSGMATATDVLLFGGGAVAVTGIVLGILYGLDHEEELPPGVQSAALMCTAEGCVASVGGVL